MNIDDFIKIIKHIRNPSFKDIDHTLRKYPKIKNVKSKTYYNKNINIQYVDKKLLDYGFGQYNPSEDKILINKNLIGRESLYFTIGHEIGHLLSNHNRNNWINYWNNLDNQHIEEMTSDIVGYWFYKKNGFIKMDEDIEIRISLYYFDIGINDRKKVYIDSIKRIKKLEGMVKNI